MAELCVSQTSQKQVFTGHSETPSSEARFARLLAEDAQFRAARPIEAITTAKMAPGVRLGQIAEILMQGYADRPALGQRAHEPVIDPASGRRTSRLLPAFETITYRELWSRARAIASDWHHAGETPIAAGDFACVLGFASPDYAAVQLACIHAGIVVVPLQTSAPVAQHAAIIAETEPRVLAASVNYLDAAVEALLAGTAPQRLDVFDCEPDNDDHRDALKAARARLAEAGCATVVETFDAVVERGRASPPVALHVPAADEDPLAFLFYTSGTTGTPKGVMLPQSIILGTFQYTSKFPSITLSFMPMSHLVGYGYMFMALANGGTSYCSPRSDLSTLFEDLELVRPTMSSIVPRVCEMLYHHYVAEVDRRVAAAGHPDADAIAEAVRTDMRERLLGGRLLAVGCGSAVLSPEIYAFMEEMLGMHMPIGYSSTEMATATILVDGRVQRPPTIAYKLVDVPELGYFGTDKPHPRGELLVKANKFMLGYFKRPDLTAEKLDGEGFYRTGDVMAEIEPDHLVYVDRCNNVLKLSQGEFVAVARLEALYTHSPVARQVYVYGRSDRAFLLAVVVPTAELAAQMESGAIQTDAVKAAIRRSFQQIAQEHQLNGYEVPRDIVLETEPFTLENGLLSGIGKFLRPKFKERYGERLDAIYAQLAQDRLSELRALRVVGADRPVVDTVMRAVQATLGLGAADVQSSSRFGDLGGDSLAALTFSNLLEEIFGVEVPVGVIINPAGNVALLADYIEAARKSDGRPTFATVHAPDSAEVHVGDLALGKFIPAEILDAAPGLAMPEGPIRTVLMTGATGFLGRFQALAWLERLALTGGKLILIVRGADAAQARARIEAALDTDPDLLTRFRALAADHLEVLPGDLGLPSLGLDAATWDRLAGTVDLIVHTGAHVNHVLPYNQLFAANVVSTAEVVRLALTTRLKRIDYVSTLGVIALAQGVIDEDVDIRRAIPSCDLDQGYANGYNVSKWASEVLVRGANDLCGLPVAVFRPGMILAHSRYAGQLNVPDMFTRLLFSLAATGIAPATFYAQDIGEGRPAARYEGLPVDFLAEALTAIGASNPRGFTSYNLASSHAEGASLDDFVDWMIDAGCAIERIDRYDDWLARFETAMHGLPDEQRQESLIAILQPYRQPQAAGAGAGAFLPVARFDAAATAAGHAVPRLTPALIAKYLADLRQLGFLPQA